MRNPTFLQQKSKKLGQFFQIEKLLINSICEYFGRTGYLTPALSAMGKYLVVSLVSHWDCLIEVKPDPNIRDDKQYMKSTQG